MRTLWAHSWDDTISFCQNHGYRRVGADLNLFWRPFDDIFTFSNDDINHVLLFSHANTSHFSAKSSYWFGDYRAYERPGKHSTDFTWLSILPGRNVWVKLYMEQLVDKISPRAEGGRVNGLPSILSRVIKRVFEDFYGKTFVCLRCVMWRNLSPNLSSWKTQKRKIWLKYDFFYTICILF